MNQSSPTLAIVDFEATCCDRLSFPRHEMEIIEIGAVAVDAASGDVVSEFGTFIRPVRHPQLTDFCKDLTTITQGDVDMAPAFPDALAAFAAWIARSGLPVFCSWGDYDRKQLAQDCDHHGLPYPFLNGHRNLKAEFSTAIGSQKRFGLGQALGRLRLEFSGTPHRGIDDARNIARVYKEILMPGGRKNS
ncbi:exonuclease domain-containing protein [Luteolibacter flavescens]|uniref:Exonuclease domain-containing protein n=1 Tax=Luteolibacter flavescens TaxID=1859460 RepID=A0ABT3FTK3_9BACT|nr:3'-5' exonuclease [Luteolibacter flavescens]MCW1886649.1 exonuclease domain-containing protein [Luteolibacter flavescens]